MQIPTVQPTSHHLSECQEQRIDTGCGKRLCRQEPDWGFSSRVTFEINQIVKMINFPKLPWCIGLVVLPQWWGLLWFPVPVRRREYIWIIRGLFALFFENVCRVFIFLHKTLQSSYLYLVFSFSTILLVEIPSQVLCTCGTEENAGSSIGCALWWNGVSGRLQGFCSVDAVFWIRHHPTVSFFNHIPQNWEWDSRFLFCFHT